MMLIYTPGIFGDRKSDILLEQERQILGRLYKFDPSVNIEKILQGNVRVLYPPVKLVFEMKDFYQMNVSYKFIPFLGVMLLARSPLFEGAEITFHDELPPNNVEEILSKAKENNIIPKRELLYEKVKSRFENKEIIEIKTKNFLVSIQSCKCSSFEYYCCVSVKHSSGKTISKLIDITPIHLFLNNKLLKEAKNFSGTIGEIIEKLLVKTIFNSI